MIRPTLSPLPRVDQDPLKAHANARQPSATNLSGQEKEMIDTQFPESARMSLRLYGPARPASLTPDGIGSRLDLKG